jgi:S-adenosylmethionine synthetase
MGEIELNSDKGLDVEKLVRDSCKDIGYDHADKGLDAKQVSIITELEINERDPRQ